MIFPLALSNLNNAYQLIHYSNQPTVVDQCFTNIAALQNMGCYSKFEPKESMGVGVGAGRGVGGVGVGVVGWCGGGVVGWWGITDISKYHNACIWSMG